VAFGRWGARQLLREPWDVVYSWSGVSEEICNALQGTRAIRLVVRGSAHIRTQSRLLAQEHDRTGVRQDQPSPWRIEREEREYAMADGVVVLSSFSQQTFLQEGFPEDCVHLMVSGVRTQSFRPGPEVIDARCRRILSGAPLRVLNVGTVSYRKGVYDYRNMVDQLDSSRFEFRYVGSVLPEAGAIADSLRARVHFVPRLPQGSLPQQYAWADVFVFPTIEDGFPAVCAQASAAGLPVLTTPNGAGEDLVATGETGWVLPTRDASAFARQLQWCDQNRYALADMVKCVYRTFRHRDWGIVADDFLRICATVATMKSSQVARAWKNAP
jgi:glycosyltransferase involved in cell wall biosynthesis